MENQNLMGPSLKQLQSSLPARATKPQGYWVPYAWLVRSIVEQSEGGRVVTDAVRTVLANEGLPLTSANERTLRVAYYGIREKDWPIVVVEEPEIRGILNHAEPETQVNTEYFTPPEPEEVPPPEATVDADEEFALDEELRLELEREISEGFIPDPED